MNVQTADSSLVGGMDALELIKHDHEEVKSLFAQVLGGDVKGAQMRKTVAQICDALTLHAKMEEKLFYPALRKAGKEQEKDSVLEAAEEHGVVKDLIKKIQKTEPRDETLKAKLTVLKESVEHHVQEEESEMFDEARRVLGAQRLAKLGDEMAAYKERNSAGARAGSGRKKVAARAVGAKNVPRAAKPVVRASAKRSR